MIGTLEKLFAIINKEWLMAQQGIKAFGLKPGGN